MNWKTEAMEKLRKYDAMQKSIDNIPAEIVRLENEYDGESIDNAAMRKELELALDNAQAWVDIVDHGLEALEPAEKLVLHRMYICRHEKPIPILCDELGLEQSSVYRKRDKALRKFTLALYGIAE